jgi:two-component system NtrC family sensor kinase
MPLVATRTRAPARILVVDDHEDVRKLLVVVLSVEDRVVDAAENGTEALRRLERGRYDLVVSDLKMPELDGPGLYRAVVRRWPNDHPPFLFVSGFADAPEYAGFLNRAHVPLLFKPFDADHLSASVRRMLEEHEAHPCRR